MRSTPCEGVALLRLNRPEKLNALSLELRRTLAHHLDAAEADPRIAAIVIAGDERAFAAGADLAELVDLEPGDRRFDDLRVAWDAMALCTKPIIAAVRGFALGGGFELALQCDLIVAGEGARFGLPEPKVGIVPGAGGMQRLARIVGRQQAMLWLLTGDMIDAATAAARGIVSHVVADDGVEARALELATRAVTMAPGVMTIVKKALRLSENSFVGDAVAAERPWFEDLFGKPHQRDAMMKILSRSGNPKAAR
nr:enoyl-CoA hydratase-related protein [Sphingobium subterraneum]